VIPVLKLVQNTVHSQSLLRNLPMFHDVIGPQSVTEKILFEQIFEKR